MIQFNVFTDKNITSELVLSHMQAYLELKNSYNPSIKIDNPDNIEECDQEILEKICESLEKIDYYDTEEKLENKHIKKLKHLIIHENDGEIEEIECTVPVAGGYAEVEKLGRL